ncbi:alpha/beta hydrolase family protein [Novosphingobium aquimarinum]|uniref:DUF2974 domain-containing protein n=1 Tax=Novosphingobium aquimarinum TaxID=2682494 RepID=UPI0018DE6667|nr:DUF2974 domain-containing protein [Novosphingobium aquimarinum]
MALLGGCAAGALPDLTQAHGPCLRDGKDGWCGFTREAAGRSWTYAQMATNAYCDDAREFTLPTTIREVARLPERAVCELERRRSDASLTKDVKKALKAQIKAVERDPREKSGFAYALFDRSATPGGPPVERVIAFRGSDIAWSDWAHGNLGKEQYEQAQALYEEQKRVAGVPVVVTGHSLGGALAMQVSIDNLGANAYVFNTSPRYTVPAEPNRNVRLSIKERGDVLDLVRARSIPVEQELIVINCAPESSGLADHKMEQLADCLTWIAAKDVAAARASVATNAIEAPPGEAAMETWGRKAEPEE